MTRTRLVAGLVVLLGSCTRTSENRQPVVKPDPVSIRISPILYSTSPNAIRISLDGEQALTRPVTSVLGEFTVTGPNGAVQTEPVSEVPEETYRGSEVQSFLLPNGIPSGVYTARVRLEDWGVRVRAGSREVVQEGALQFATNFFFSQDYFEFVGLSVCRGGESVTLSFSERIAPISQAAFLERVRIVRSGSDVVCQVSASAIDQDNIVFGSSITLACDQFEAPFSVSFQGLRSQTGLEVARLKQGLVPLGVVEFVAADLVSDDCLIFHARVL